MVFLGNKLVNQIKLYVIKKYEGIHSLHWYVGNEYTMETDQLGHCPNRVPVEI